MTTVPLLLLLLLVVVVVVVFRLESDELAHDGTAVGKYGCSST